MATKTKHKQRSLYSYRKDISTRDSFFERSARLVYSRRALKTHKLSFSERAKRLMNKFIGRGN